MRNIILIILETLICFTTMIILSKKYKTDGLYVFGIIATFASCIMNLKKIELMGISVPVGFGVTTSLIIAGNLITQKRGPEEVKTYLALILVTALVSCCFLNLSGLMESSNYNLFANKSYDSIFIYNLRVYLGLIVSVITSIYLSSKLYSLLKRLQNKIFLSNIFSIIIIEFLENTAFILIAYLGGYCAVDLALCIIFRYTIKTIIGLLGTIPIYLGTKY